MTAMLFNTRMDIYEIRRKNLLKLLADYRSAGKKDVQFGSVASITPSHLSQLKSGATNIGDEVARRIESGLSLDHGWMDQMHFDVSSKTNIHDDIIALAEAIASQSSDKQEQIKDVLKVVGINIPIPGQPVAAAQPGAIVVTDPEEKNLLQAYRHVDASGKKSISIAASGALQYFPIKTENKKANGK